MMTETPAPDSRKNNTRKSTPKWLRRPGRWLSNNSILADVAAKLIVWYLKFVFKTNSWVVEPENILEEVEPDLPVIVAVWHGQPVLLPAVPIGLSASVMISKSLDGEITARVAKAFGSRPIRASGGRDPKHTLKKGALKGFLDMHLALENGENVLQSADIPKGTPRKVGLGIVTLAKKSGRPIIPLAVASSRRWLASKSWDRTTVNLPFGKAAIVAGKRIWIDKDADSEKLEAARLDLKHELDRVTKQAYALTGNPEN